MMEAISAAGLTLNSDTHAIASNKIHSWGLILSVHGMQPDPIKVDALISSQHQQIKMTSSTFYVLCSLTLAL